jgi:hypothetical protein
MDWKSPHLLYTMLAIAGGVAKQLNTYVETRQWHLGRFLASAISSGFSGYMAAQVMWQMAPKWAFIAAGIGGYMGGEAMDFLASLLKRKIESAVKTQEKREDGK